MTLATRMVCLKAHSTMLWVGYAVGCAFRRTAPQNAPTPTTPSRGKLHA